jgi:uncharacterized membrane protein HdeD (DUF308 family)
MLKFQRSTLFFWCVILGMGGFNALSELNVNTVLRTELLGVIALLGGLSAVLHARGVATVFDRRRSKPSN